MVTKYNPVLKSETSITAVEVPLNSRRRIVCPKLLVITTETSEVIWLFEITFIVSVAGFGNILKLIRIGSSILTKNCSNQGTPRP